ncbi:MAG: cytochrome b/b6 domain-containing protein [Burkholderiaceae bacterium]|nr:cytochrome b/b6 domain-containing protein [Burkholderiaceae bacterium]
MNTRDTSQTALSPTTTIRVWDLPTRIFHWGLVATVTGCFITIKLGGLWMDWHVRFGLATLALILFRLIWGVVGPRYARFSQFVRWPWTVVRYLQGQHQHIAGHNPLGAISVIAMLLAFSFQAFSGLFANDDIFTSGPLAYLSTPWSNTLTGLHKLNEWIMLGLISLHVLTIVWYRLVRKQNLAAAMLHGDTTLGNTGLQAVGAADSWAVRIGALFLAIAVSMATWWLTTLAPVGGDMSFM